MDLAVEIWRILLPVVIVGVIAIFVILRMNHKYNKGNLGKKKSKSDQNLLDSLIPLGMMIGCALGVLISLYSKVSLLPAISLGGAIGLLFGYFAYEIYGKMKKVISDGTFSEEGKVVG